MKQSVKSLKTVGFLTNLNTNLLIELGTVAAYWHRTGTNHVMIGYQISYLPCSIEE